MDEVYLVVRLFYFIWSFCLFLTLIYWGIQDLLLGRRCGHIQVPPEHYLWATASLGSSIVLIVSLSEIFLQTIAGGVRTFLPFLFLMPASFAVYHGAFRVQMHRKAIELGVCGGGK